MSAFVQVSTWDATFIASLREHYSGSSGPPPGKKLVWRIFDEGVARGWIGIGEPSFKLAPRRALGLLDGRPLPFTVGCFVYRLERGGASRASAILREWHTVASAEWAARYGDAPIHWETLVDPSKVASEVPGACFRRAGYRSIGMTTGRGARRPPGSTRGPRVWTDTTPKLVLYRGPLTRIPEAA